MSHNIIRDGYTKDGYIAAVERLHDELRFKFRPMLPEQLESLSAAVEKADASKASLLVAAAMQKHVTEWGETWEAPECLPASLIVDNFRRLHPLVLAKLRRIVEGVSAGDLDPKSTSKPTEVDEYIAGLEAELAGQSPGGRELSANQKN